MKKRKKTVMKKKRRRMRSDCKSELIIPII
jgi:hypothetical protein